MTTFDHEKLMVEMCQKWPSKFTDADLAHWCQQLNRFDVDDILGVLTEWKSESKYVPKLPEIRGRLAKNGRAAAPASTGPVYVSAIAQSMARDFRMNGKPEAELLLRYHRFWFFRYRKELLADRTGAERTPTERDRLMIDSKRIITLETCARDLWGAGCSEQAAKDLAMWFDASPADFQTAVSQIGHEGEVPEYA